MNVIEELCKQLYLSTNAMDVGKQFLTDVPQWRKDFRKLVRENKTILAKVGYNHMKEVAK